MASIERTAYPRLKKHFTNVELRDYYTPLEDEIFWVQNHAKGSDSQLHLLVMLKTFERLGYFPPLEDVPDELIRHLRAALRFKRNVFPVVSKNTVTKHCAAVRSRLQVQAFSRQARKTLTRAVLVAANTMDNPADLINVGIEELIKERFELPAFSAIDKRVQRVRNFVNNRIFTRIVSRLSKTEQTTLESLLQSEAKTFRTPFNRLKDLPKRPTLSHLQDLLEHLDWLRSVGDFAASLDTVPKLKIKHFAAHAAALDSNELKDYGGEKRAVLIICLIHRAMVKTRDALCAMFGRRMAKFNQQAKEKLQELQLRQREKTERLLTIFGSVLNTVKIGETDQQVGSGIKSILETHNLDSLIEDCEAVAALYNDNHFPFL